MSVYTIDIKPEDIKQIQLNELLLWWIRTKHPDEVEKIEKYIQEQHDQSQDD